MEMACCAWTVCTGGVVCARHLLPFWESGTLGYTGGRCLCDWSPVKALGAGSLVNFPDRQHFTCVGTTHCWGNWMSYGLYWEKTLGSLHLVYPRLCPILFFFADFASYSFTVMNLSHDYDYMLNAVSPPSECITFQRRLCLYPVGIYCTHCFTYKMFWRHLASTFWELNLFHACTVLRIYICRLY